MPSTSQHPGLYKRERWSTSGGNDVTDDRRQKCAVTCLRRHRIANDAIYRLVGLLLLICCLQTQYLGNLATAQPTITVFDTDNYRVFRDPNNSPGYYSTLFVDQKDSRRLYVGAVDFVYGLNASDIESSYEVSENLTATINYTATYATSVVQCQYANSVVNKSYGCRNHVRAVFSMPSTGEIYVCSTGAFNPQEYYLNSNLRVASVERRAPSGTRRCPHNPAVTYTAALVDTGNPYNFSALYAGVTTNSFTSAITLLRSPLYSSRFYSSPPVQSLSTMSENTWINTAGDVFVVGVFDIDKYVYYFFRELALESTWLSNPTYYSRVARVCKNDLGVDNLGLTSRFTSFSKARLVCSLSGSSESVAFFFNDVQDVKFNSTSNQFFALFTANRNFQRGSAVCQYSLNDINNVFSGLWVERTVNSAWVATDASSVPPLRPGQCLGQSLKYDTTTASFILSHQLMKNLVQPVTGNRPSYYAQQSAFSRLEVDTVGNITIFFLYLPDRAAVHRVSAFTDAATGQIQSTLLSIWQPFNGITNSLPLPVSSMLLSSTDDQNPWLYLTTDVAVIQLRVEQCSSYEYGADCVVDPYCGWNVTSASCQRYQPGLSQAAYSSDPFAVCQPNCTTSYLRPNVVPGMSILLNCSSPFVQPEADVTWYFQDANRSGRPVRVAVETDDNYVLTRDSGLVILKVNRTQHVGVFQCVVSGGVVLAEHIITTSVCEFGDNVREVWTTEFINYCRAFDNYLTEYNNWLCMQQEYCAQNNCTSNDASQCNTTWANDHSFRPQPITQN